MYLDLKIILTSKYILQIFFYDTKCAPNGTRYPFKTGMHGCSRSCLAAETYKRDGSTTLEENFHKALYNTITNIIIVSRNK